MKIVSKFDCGDTAWFYNNDLKLLIPAMIEGIISYEEKGGFVYKIHYYSLVTDSVSIDCRMMAESNLFRTPDEFIKKMKEVDYTERMQSFLRAFNRYLNEK